MVEQPHKHEELLWKLDPGIFQQRTFPGMDALVAIIPKGEEIPPEVKQAAGISRWFPLDGEWNAAGESGWKVVYPYHGQDYNPNLFTVLKKGWDHEHCDGCQATIDVGDSCWTARTEDDFFVVCDKCYGELKTTRG